MPADAIPLRNFKLTLEYDGKAFCGWQTQMGGLRTAQNHLEEQLEKIFKHKVHVHASGRTDSSVHALSQVAHVKARTALEPAVIQKALNAFLDKDITVLDCVEVPLHFHAQNDAKTKIYRYTILNRSYPSALWSDRAFFYPNPLNLTAMRRAARFLKGTHDFKTFQAASSRSRIKNTRRTVNIKITREGDFIHITMSSDGFLYKMVRNIVGLLIAVGSDRLAPEAAVKLLGSKDRRQAPKTAPGHGLYLVSVSY